MKSPLLILLKKVAEGDKSALDKVYPLLADRLVVVPVLSVIEGSKDETKISVITIKEGETKYLPIFTSPVNLKSWCTKLEITAEGMSFSCADICQALGNGRWLIVDSGLDHCCEIEPSYVLKIAQFEPEEDQWELPKTNISKPLINTTQEVSITPSVKTLIKNYNPDSAVSSFPDLSNTKRTRSKDDIEDPRATMDLSSLQKKII